MPPRQPSLFGVDASDPALSDLAGLLAGPGELGRMGGTARIGVLVDAGWRVHVLIPELVRRGVAASWAATGIGFRVTSAYTARLVPLARAWRDGPPPALHLGGHALRLWVAAAGAPSEEGYLLGLGGPDHQAGWPAIGSALAAAGLGAALVVSAGAAAPTGGAAAAYRITGRRRLARLAELVGDPPEQAPEGAWPASPGQPVRPAVPPSAP